MDFIFDERASDSHFVEKIWHSQSERSGFFTSVAVSHWEMVVTRQKGKMTFTVRGPETNATVAPIPSDAEFLGIKFKLGTFMPHLPAINLVNSGINLPEATGKSFWLHGSAWGFPDFENADTFVDKLVRTGLLVREPTVEAALQGHLKDLSLRSVQRRFLQATGLTYKTIQQIERARHATALLEQGVSILDAVEETGYFDQAHLTNSLKRFMGQTPTQIAHLHQPE